MVLSHASVLICISARWGPSNRRWGWAEGGILYRDHSTYFIHLLGERDASDNVRKTSLHFAAEALTTLHWSRLSDRIGRSPFSYHASRARSCRCSCSDFPVP